MIVPQGRSSITLSKSTDSDTFPVFSNLLADQTIEIYTGAVTLAASLSALAVAVLI